MLISEIVLRKEFLEQKLVSIAEYIQSLKDIGFRDKGDMYNKALKLQFDLLSKLRSHKVLLDRLNKDTYISVNDEEITVYEAIYLLKTLLYKIETLNVVTEGAAQGFLDLEKILLQKEALIEEYILLRTKVNISDLNTVWNND